MKMNDIILNRTATVADVAIYMRYSSTNQTENSIAYQRENIYRYCAMHNYNVVDEYVDEAFSATTDRRPAFQEMIKAVEHKPTWTKVLVYDMSRFARNNSDAIKYTNRLNDANIELISVTQEFGNSNEGFLLQGMTNLMNDYYSRNNSKHTHAGLMVTAKKGNHCGGVPPLGYDVDANAELVINEDEAEIVRTIFDMYELGYTYSKIAEKLNERGYKNKYGRPFVKTSFDSILRQEKYLGTYFWNRTRQKNSKHKRNSHAHKPKEQQVYLPDRIPSIISKEQFERVQKKLHDSQINRSKSRRHYMLSGLNVLKCAECGSLMHGKITRTHGKEYETYFCPKHKIKECSMKEIRCDGINTLIATLLTDDICNRDDLQQICTMMNYNIEYVSAKSKLKGIEKSIQNLLKSLADGCPGEEVAVKLRELSADKKQLQKVITDYESSASLITPENIKENCDKFKEMLITSNDPEIKQYLKNCIESINVDKDDVKIVLKVS